MQLPDQILGKNAVAKIQERIKAPVLTIGADRFTRASLASTNCFNFLAAASLSNILTNQLKVKNTSDLFNNVKPDDLAVPGLGVVCLASLGAAFELKLGKTLTDYIDRHRAEGERYVTFDTVKRSHERDAEAERRTVKAEKRRKGLRNRTAHEHRVRRHVERATKTNGNGAHQ